MTWIKGISLKDIKGPTLYIAVASALVMVLAHAFGWHLTSATVAGFFTLVASLIWTNGKFGLGAVHKANFWITVLAAAILIVNKVAGWNFSSTDIYGFVAIVVGIIFHTAAATPVVQPANPVAPIAPAASTTASQEG